MTDDEYREFLQFLFERYIRERLPRVRRRFRHHMEDEWHYHLDEVAHASHVFRHIESQCHDDADVYRTFTLDRIRDAVRETHRAVDFGDHVAEEAGFLDAIDAHGQDIIDGLQPQHLPDADREVLREMGSFNPELELRALVLRTKGVRERLRSRSQEISLRAQLNEVEERLERAAEAFDKAGKAGMGSSDTSKPTHSRRWFKGIGQIAQGAALSIANVALAVGALKFPVSPETQTWGAIASVTTGVGTILSGCGDLRNE